MLRRNLRRGVWTPHRARQQEFSGPADWQVMPRMRSSICSGGLLDDISVEAAPREFVSFMLPNSLSGALPLGSA
jgi:hypothetical protein